MFYGWALVMETKFQVGDKISAFGVEGEVVSINVSSDFPIKCNFVNGYSATFSINGKHSFWHKEPSLKLIERPKKKVKMYKVLFKNLDYINQFQVSGDHYADREDFESRVYSNQFIQFIQLIKESEIEVEE